MPSPCLLCKSSSHKVIFSYKEPDRYEAAVRVTAKNYFRKWVRCSKCGFFYSIYSRPPKVIHTIYETAYRDTNANWRKETAEEIFNKITALPEHQSETKKRVCWIKETIERVWEDGIIKKPAPPFSALDIGGGAAIFAYEFQDRLWRSYIIDPAKNNDFVKKKLKIPLIQKFYKPNRFHRKFNLISLVYVLEHMANPRSLLKSVRKDMDANSFLYVEVPDALASRLKPKDDDIFNACHLWMFDQETLTRILKECGFEALSIRRIKTLRNHYAVMALAIQKR
ncbi:MAG: hypothetical protein G01um101417_308 [Parcubacteria group bacterium Gr01-1014_17]|nr:MAG: hypothetical protein G01um101417_308 [Parcubacteria group bacterium Gr01-1014_17]